MLLTVIVEVILLGILIGGSYVGYKKGLFAIALKPCKTIICLGLSFVFCKTVGELVFMPMVSSYIFDKTSDIKIGHSEYIPAMSALEQAVVTNATSLGLQVAQIVSSIFAFVLLFILARTLVSLLIYGANSVFSYGIVGRINRVLGFLCAGVVSLATAHLFTLGSQYLFSFEEFQNSELTEGFSGGLLYRLFLRLNS